MTVYGDEVVSYRQVGTQARGKVQRGIVARAHDGMTVRMSISRLSHQVNECIHRKPHLLSLESTRRS